jgi:Concanavalin A-like lectin/glucanases superfamily
VKKIFTTISLLGLLFVNAQTPIQEFNFDNNLTNVANNITLTGTSVTFTTPRISGTGNSAKIPYTNTITGAISNLPTGNSSRTFTFWVRFFNSGIAPGFTEIFQAGNGLSATQGHAMGIRYDGGGANTFRISGANYGDWATNMPSGFSGSGFLNNTWHHLALSYNNTDQVLRLYFNGALIGSANTNGNLNTAGTNINFGTVYANNAAGFDLEDFKIYNTALTQAQIEAQSAVLPTVTTPIVTNILPTAATINFTANAGGASSTTVIKYGTASNNLNQTLNTTTINNIVNRALTGSLINLVPATQYFYQVEVSNPVTGTVSSTIGNFTTLPAVPLISTPTSSPTTTTICGSDIAYRVSLAQQNASIAIKYGTSSTLASLATSKIFANQTGSTTQNYIHTLADLLPSTTYYYQINVTEANNTVTSSPILSFTTPAASGSTAASFFSLVRDTSLVANSATIKFKLITNISRTINIAYRPISAAFTTNSTDLAVSVNSNPATNYEIALAGLAPNTTYIYRVYAFSSGWNTSSSDEYRFTTPSVLPVTLSSFTANLNNNTTQLIWQTSTEINASHFEIEYSNNGKDFTSVETVKAIGSGSASQRYQAFHQVNTVPHHYYRLKMVDKDGRYAYSAIVAINGNGTSALNIVLQNTVVKNQLQFSVTSNKATTVNMAVTNSVGQTVLQPNKKSISAGSNSFSYIINNLSSGVYFLEMVDDSGTKQVVKFLK